MFFTEIWLKDTVDSSAISIDHYLHLRKDSIRAQHGGICFIIYQVSKFIHSSILLVKRGSRDSHEIQVLTESGLRGH